MQLKGIHAIKRGPVLVTGPLLPRARPSVPLTGPPFPILVPLIFLIVSHSPPVLIA